MIDETMKKSWEEKGCCLFAEAGSLGSFTPSKAGKGEARPVLKPSGGEAAMSGGNISVSSDSCEQNVIYWTSLLYCMTAKVMSSACRCQLQCLVGRGDGVGQGGGVGGDWCWDQIGAVKAEQGHFPQASFIGDVLHQNSN